MLSDVIASLATPPGTSALALIRLAGHGCYDVASSVLHPFTVDPPRTARLAEAVDPSSGELLDRVLYVSYRAPKSYTGEDAVEVSTHGGLLVPGEVLGALFAAGARQAGRGEFTRRALLNGKIDLLQAEAIGDLVAATAPAQRRSALNQLDRGLASRISELRSGVLELESLVCYEIDFPDEDSGPVSNERVERAIAESNEVDCARRCGRAIGILRREVHDDCSAIGGHRHVIGVGQRSNRRSDGRCSNGPTGAGNHVRQARIAGAVARIVGNHPGVRGLE